MVISHNLLAMNAQRQFNITGTNKKKSTEKLASGYKINRAADDAAGLAISEKMRRQIRGLNQGARNTQDGISLLQVADGALNEVHDMLHRMSELSIQAANGTNTEQDREYIQKEIAHLTEEISRISDTTEFNGKLLFDGSCAAVEPGNAPNLSTMDALQQLRSASYNTATQDITYKGEVYSKDIINAYLATQSTNSIYWKMLEDDLRYDGPGGADTVALMDNLKLIAKNDILMADSFKSAEMLNETQYNNSKAAINDRLNYADIAKTAESSRVQAMFSDLHTRTGDTYYGGIITRPVYSVFIGEDIAYQAQEYGRGKSVPAVGLGLANMYSGNLNNLSFLYLSSDFAFGTDQNQVVESFKAIQNLIGGFNPDGSVNEEMQNKGLWIQSGADAGNGMYISVDTMNLSALGINGVDVSTEAGASNAIDLIGNAVDKISSMRSSFGAQQNRLEHTYKNVTNIEENTQAAESRIRDTDMAKEMVELSKHNILEQAGTTMIAQANQINQGVLNLLQ